VGDLAGRTGLSPGEGKESAAASRWHLPPSMRRWSCAAAGRHRLTVSATRSPLGCPVASRTMRRGELSRPGPAGAETIERFGTIDILVNNADLVPQGSLLELDEATIGWAIRRPPPDAVVLMSS
jgi:hypothetical protein